MVFFLRRYGQHLLFTFLCFLSLSVAAGGIALDRTRLIYPYGGTSGKSESVNLKNTDKKDTFLVQSWVENPDGSKSRDFIVTPPLFTSAPNNENILRVIYNGPPLPKDRESLYYFNVKGIPSVDKNKLGQGNMLILAGVTRIKLFVRPEGLTSSVDKAPDQLRFRKENQKLTIINPTPYYITFAELNLGKKKLEAPMLPPKGQVSVDLNDYKAKKETASQAQEGAYDIFFNTINDYGGITGLQKGIFSK